MVDQVIAYWCGCQAERRDDFFDCAKDRLSSQRQQAILTRIKFIPQAGGAYKIRSFLDDRILYASRFLLTFSTLMNSSSSDLIAGSTVDNNAERKSNVGMILHYCPEYMRTSKRKGQYYFRNFLFSLFFSRFLFFFNWNN